ncbi:hydantoinase/oxoprolinase [Colletotrichum karsti]|uniref:Hydantoinase/oxoprolinase n=1 Tax=Colletotrichum karsti TaxID=1095194 RepID=A0A9P6I9B1_9PEZI|nr:hydantoinase/oxoprolinase [Colletotrichum karsti]KAF9878718.1 hydantoinase/oxoprolinase [Colletotrichum karsti]
MTSGSRHLRIGVDVGGTNTDGVVLDPSRASEPDKGIVAWHKSPTTTNPSDGINNAIVTMFESSQIQPGEIASVTIGTTHFVNALIERDESRLAPVAVIRLTSQFSKHDPPCLDWPDDLRELILGHYALCKGGLEVDGGLISDIDPEEIRAQCAIIREKGIRNVVVNGIFSPIDTTERQEERAADIIRSELPGCTVTCSKDVANLGFQERENAAILNATVLDFARKTIRSFQEPIKRLGLHCPVFISQNNGTILSGDMAANLPIRTFSSGPTNSMRGAAFLVQDQLDEAVMVVDIGGTTTDVGLLQANGFPRQQAAFSEFAGVRLNFSCPDVKSIGLGGGSIVRKNDGKLTVGPDSVGYKIKTEALVFGGSTLTATDCTVLANDGKPFPSIGDTKLVSGALDTAGLSEFTTIVQSKIEKVIDTMKTSPNDIPVLLVGGGAVIAPDELRGASKVLKHEWAGVANAIGAAIARVSATVDTVKSTESRTSQEILAEVEKEVKEKAVTAGAIPSSVQIVDVDTIPLAYIANKSRFIVRAAGDFDFSRTDLASIPIGDEADVTHNETNFTRSKKSSRTKTKKEVDVLTYKPVVKDRTWYISETDLDWISIGCYILGTGGGGSPYSQQIILREKLRKGAVVRVVNPNDIPDEALVGCGGYAGSPTVAIEKKMADEMQEAQEEMYKNLGTPATHMIAVEIGGANGLQSMMLGSSTNMNVPAVDGDWMGRAYPTKWQTTPVVFNERSPIWTPVTMSDGNGAIVTMSRASSDKQVERVMRAALAEMGSQVAVADPPVTGAETKRWVVEHTLSQSWRIGRAVAKARKLNRVDNVAETIIEECGGPGAAKVLFKGKIVGVERVLRKGHVYGECIIEGADISGSDEPGQHGVQEFKGFVKIPFKNENIAAIRTASAASGSEAAGKERQEDVLAIVPDLIAVIDAQNGEAIGTPEYRYGLLVIVLGIAASDRWTGSERGIEIGGPEAFGFSHLKYNSLGKFVKPKSVIDEYDPKAKDSCMCGKCKDLGW